MALTATIYKVSIQIADMDRHYYQDHALTIACHPSETDERLMVRILAFARHASEGLSFGKGRIGVGIKPADDEPDLWQKDLTGAVDLWIEVGLPDEKSIRQACGRAKQVVVYAYGGAKTDRWWNEFVGARRAVPKNLTVINVSPDTTRALAALVTRRDLHLTCTVQDGDMVIGDGDKTVQIALTILKEAQAV